MPPVSSDPTPASFDHSILITSAPTRVLAAFFDPVALGGVVAGGPVRHHARPIGVFAVEWEPTTDADEVLGRLGGVFHGIVDGLHAGARALRRRRVVDPARRRSDGPDVAEVSCTMDGPACRLRVRQSGFEDGRGGGATTR